MMWIWKAGASGGLDRTRHDRDVATHVGYGMTEIKIHCTVTAVSSRLGGR